MYMPGLDEAANREMLGEVAHIQEWSVCLIRNRVGWRVWHLAHVRLSKKMAGDCMFSRNCFVHRYGLSTNGHCLGTAWVKSTSWRRGHQVWRRSRDTSQF